MGVLLLHCVGQVSGTDGIFIYTFGVVPGGGGVIVDHLIIKGDGSLIKKNGQTAAGVFIYHDAPGDVYVPVLGGVGQCMLQGPFTIAVRACALGSGNFVFDSLDVSGFSSSGMETFRWVPGTLCVTGGCRGVLSASVTGHACVPNVAQPLTHVRCARGDPAGTTSPAPQAGSRTSPSPTACSTRTRGTPTGPTPRAVASCWRA